MNKSCARCNKTVYPIELLSCLDKVSQSSFMLKAKIISLLRSNFFTYYIEVIVYI